MTNNIAHIELPAGKYVVAVSGGVDSMVLLNIVSAMPGLDIVVAHVDHGIRPDSENDLKLIQKYIASRNNKILLEHTHLRLPADVSEAAARSARYNFLQQCRIKHGASYIITAHHADDLLETAIINLLRGTGWRGIAPFARASLVLRPLLRYTKQDILAYAAEHNVPWREDSTNLNQRYLRNYVRHSILQSAKAMEIPVRSSFLQLIRKQQELRRTIHSETLLCLKSHVDMQDLGAKSQRYWWIMLPHSVAYELLQSLCQQIIGHTLLQSRASEALLFIKVGRPGKVLLLTSKWQLRLTRKTFVVEPC